MCLIGRERTSKVSCDRIYTVTIVLVAMCSHAGGTESPKLAFVAIGDFGGVPQPPYFTYTQKKIAKVMGKYADLKKVKFVIGLGDNFYFEGVKNVDDHRFISTFEHVYTTPTLKTATWCMVAGNHDHASNVSAQIAYTKRSRRWHFPYFFYTEVFKIPGSYKTVQLVMIDTTLLCCRNQRNLKTLPEQEEQLRWIKDTLRDSEADYLIVAGHHPVLSAGIHGSTPYLISNLKPLLEEYDVTVYLSGHDHNLQHLKEEHSNVHYFVTGNGNFYSPYPVHKKTVSGSLKFFKGDCGAFTLLEATPEFLKVSQIDDCGNELYKAKLKPRTIIQSLEDEENAMLDEFFTTQS